MPKFTTFDGLELFYSDEGEGLPVLCLTGLTRNSRDFDYVAPHLKGVRLIRMDYRGRGQSDRGDWHGYTVPNEARDAIALLDHLGIKRTAILGTSRGGIIAMMLGATARDRLIGVALNDIGPEIETGGLDKIMGYLGVKPAFASRAEMAAAMPGAMAGFANVPASRWLENVERSTVETESGLDLAYDAHLRDAVLEGAAQPAPDFWPFFEALAGLPLALIRGENSDILSAKSAAEMGARHPGMIFANVPDRAHIPFLDEPESLAALNEWIAKCQKI
ncbi:MAG: pimeloyl-ACP methyl ester carboxylesterase [Halocynthiibacter sp.]|jgi:pimeloyl-ACP methyl ester carboxylesterase